MNEEIYDALVIGGGPAGATAALLLAQKGWRIGLVEKAQFPRRKVCGEFLSATNLPLLDRLGLAGAFHKLAGPEIRQIGLFTRDTTVTADIPVTKASGGGWGRAWRRESLDSVLLGRAAEAGVRVIQPASVEGWRKSGEGFRCHVMDRESRRALEIVARILIAAHGSWGPSLLPTQPPKPATQPNDLLAFKAHFTGTNLAPGLMPLLAFPGGYGGMVQCDGGRMSLSFCVQRERLEKCRQARPGASAADAVVAHLKACCAGARQVLASARLDGGWLSAGPIRPGIRGWGADGVFLVGNAAGEAHPVIAEGISMGMQSAWLLCNRLAADPDALRSPGARCRALCEYQRDWKRSFALRIRVAAVIAHWAMRPGPVACVSPLLRWFPRLLTWTARASGKDTLLRPSSPEPAKR